MHPIIAAYISQFAAEHGYEDLAEDDKFERFVNFCEISRHCAERFDLEQVTTHPPETGIDGVAILFGDTLVTTEDEAQRRFERRKGEIDVQYIFIQAKRSERFQKSEMLTFGAAVRDLVQPDPTLPMDVVLGQAAKIHKIVIKNSSRLRHGQPACQLIYATTGDWQDDKILNATRAAIENDLRATRFFHNIKFTPLDFDDLRKRWLETRTTAEATFPVVQELSIPRMEGVRQAYLAIVAANTFIREVLSDKDGKIRSSVFEQNVRHFLGDNNDINSKVRETLHNDKKRQRFAILNNGITIVAPDVRRMGAQITIKNFQIVNGCQTSHVLFRNQAQVDSTVMIPVKIIEADESWVFDEVVEATNSQSQVTGAQFFAIKDEVRRLQQFFNAYPSAGEQDQDRRLHFERRVLEYADSDIPAMRIVDLHLLAKTFAAMFLDVPHLAAGFPNQIYEEKQDELFQKGDAEIAYYTAAFAYYRMSLLFSNKLLDRAFGFHKWHILMILKHQIAGAQPPRNSNKMQAYCEKILKVIWQPPKDSVKPYREAIKFLEGMGAANRDDPKRKSFTDACKARLR